MKKICLLLSCLLSAPLAFAQWTSSGANIYNSNTGNVGIGTSSPQNGLHVNSNTPVLSTGSGAGFRFRDLNLTTSANDWTWYSVNGYLYLLKGDAGTTQLGSGHPGNRFQINPDGGLVSYKGLTVNGLIYGIGTLYMTAQEGEGVSGTAILKGASVGSNTSVNLQLSTQANNQQVDVMRLMSTGSVGIGTTNPGAYKLAVEGKIGAREVEVKTGSWADFVFEKNYKLPSLSSVEKAIERNHHLPNIPSAREVVEKGINLGEMDARLLRKIEELTLYAIQQQKQIRNLQRQLGKLRKTVDRDQKK